LVEALSEGFEVEGGAPDVFDGDAYLLRDFVGVGRVAGGDYVYGPLGFVQVLDEFRCAVYYAGLCRYRFYVGLLYVSRYQERGDEAQGVSGFVSRGAS